jgi:ATP-dependent Clp protease ATP-binding subunit ClpB
VFFKPLQRGEIAKIVKILSKELIGRLEEKQLRLTISDEAAQFIVDKGYDPVYGARPLKRFMQHSLETMIAKEILSGKLSAGDEIIVGVKENSLCVMYNV